MSKQNLIKFLFPVFAGLLLPLAFAPFHLPGFAILSLLLLLYQIESCKNPRWVFLIGLLFGVGYFGFGVSWVFVSINKYGNLNYLLSFIITTGFILFLSLYTAIFSYLYHNLSKNLPKIAKCVVFSGLWCIIEYIRANLFGGFPWLIIGFSQIDTPVKFLLPYFGIYSASFSITLTACLLFFGLKSSRRTRMLFINLGVLIVLAPYLLKPINKDLTDNKTDAVTVAILQANMSMKDKWDENMFYEILHTYNQMIDSALSKSNIIVLPESAIPIPSYYIKDYLDGINNKANIHNKAVLLGTLFANEDSTGFYNAVLSFGNTKGNYFKKHLVAFGEYIPSPFQKIIKWLEIPVSNLSSGMGEQVPVKIFDKYVSLLICYEIGFPELIRNNLAQTSYLISLSDMGWFGNSLATYQHVQMAQALSLITNRYQIVANNNGLSQIINNMGEVTKSLPQNTKGILEGHVITNNKMTLWNKLGDKPMLLLFVLIGIVSSIFRYSSRGKYESKALTTK